MSMTPQVRFWRDPELHGLEIRYSRYRDVSFPRHAHETYSVGAVLHGSTRMWVRGCERRIAAGELALFAPGEVHSCNPEERDWAYYMFHVAPGWLEGLLRDMRHESDELGRVRFPEAVVRAPELVQRLEGLAGLVAAGAEVLERQSAAVEVFGSLLERYSRSGPDRADGDGHRAVRRARQLLADRLDERLSLEELAREAALSPYHLLRVFRRETGMTPHAWRTQRRISKGRELIAAGTPLAQAAQATGFTDQSHFSRAFKQYVGATPRQYRDALP